MRLFIAVNFSYDTRSRLMSLRDELRSRSESGNFALRDNLHLTLVFLGECDAQQTTAVKAAMDTTVFEPFYVSIGRVGRFRHDEGDIWWAGMNESKPLLELQSGLTGKLIAAGFTLDKRNYSPHITLGRKVVTNTLPWLIEPFGEQIDKIDLMISERINGRQTYTAIYYSNLI